jgi:hypothetical protein
MAVFNGLSIGLNAVSWLPLSIWTLIAKQLGFYRML